MTGSAPRVLRPSIWGPGFFTGSQVTFEVEELENHLEWNPHRPCCDLPLHSLDTLWFPAGVGGGRTASGMRRAGR